jgi:hypothetical protein
MIPKKSNPYAELANLQSNSVDVISNYHGLYRNSDKKFIIYASLGEAANIDEIVVMLNTFHQSQVAIVTTRDYPEWISKKYNCRFFKIPSGYAYYTTEMPNINLNLDRMFDKVVLSLNNRAQWNRQALHQFLLKFNLLDRCYFSYLIEDRFNKGRKLLYDQINDVVGDTWFNQGLDLESIFNQLPVKLDNFKVNDWGAGRIEYYEKSFCSFVNETYTDENYNVFFTEKTMKPLAYGHPMLLFSSAGALQQLRNLGFESFDSILDESYDTIESPQLRFEKLLEIVIDLCNHPQETLYLMHTKIKPVLEHNYNYFWNHWHSQYLKEIMLVREEIVNFFKILK